MANPTRTYQELELGSVRRIGRLFSLALGLALMPLSVLINRSELYGRLLHHPRLNR